MFIKIKKPFARASMRLLLLAAFFLTAFALTGASLAVDPVSETIARKPSDVAITPTLGSYPHTVVRTSGNFAVVPNAAPTGVTSMNVSASSDLKGTLEGDPETGVVRVSNAHPAGTYLVRVTGFGNMGVKTNAEFTLTITTSETCNSVSFASATRVGADNTPIAVAVGDFNRDGEQDLAVANSGSNTVSILLGDGAGHFGPADNFGVIDRPSALVVGDFNGDGKQDVACTNFDFNSVSILLGDGTGHLGSAANFTVGVRPGPIALGDFNGDGKQDLAVANTGSNNVSVLLGNGAGGFNAPINFNVGMFPVSMVMGDFDRDNNQDLAVANFNSPYVSILFGNGSGAFGRVINIGINFNASAITVGDFNADGRQDLAAANANSDSVAIFLNSGVGGFSNAINYSVFGEPNSLTVGDFNGDRKQDLAATTLQPLNKVVILLGDGAGGFSQPVPFDANGTWPASLVVGDFNDDVKQDLALAALNSSNVSILLNNCTGANVCSVCHEKTTTITLPCNSLEYRIHLNHGDTPGACAE